MSGNQEERDLNDVTMQIDLPAEALARAEAGQAEENSVEKRIKRDRIFMNNPVIMQGLGLAPLIVAATTVKNGLILCVAVLLLLTPTRVIAAALSRFSYFRFRGLTYALTAAAVYAGVRFLMGQIFSSADLALLGLYLPLLAADPIVLKRYERPQRERVRTALHKGIVTSLGYALTLLMIASLRELMGAGTLLGTRIAERAVFPMAQLPSGGFVITALVMGIWRAGVQSIKNQMLWGEERP